MQIVLLVLISQFYTIIYYVERPYFWCKNILGGLRKEHAVAEDYLDHFY